jgi:outer membrane protein OmpA-like peptidoglycan-associated protein
LICINAARRRCGHDDGALPCHGVFLMKTAIIGLCAAALLVSLPALADWSEPNVSGTQEYRLIKLYPQAHVAEFAVKDFDSARILIAYKAGEADPAVYDEVEGKVITYKSEHKPTTSTLEILRNYENALRGKGFEPVISGRGNKYPGLGLTEDETVGYWRSEEPGKGTIWVALHAWYNGGHDAPWSELTIVEIKAMEQTLEANAATEAKASTLADALQEAGRVAVYGITFDFNKATLRAEAAPVLGQVQAMLTANPALQVAIEGHTDSIGQPAYNLKLSGDRAGAVMAWLVAHGVDPVRLSAAGFGDTKPVADNATEDGRAKNRRVELVRR